MSSLSSNPVISQSSRYWHPCGHKQVQCFCLQSCATLKQIPGNFWLQTKPSEVTSAIDLAAWKLPLSLLLPGLSWLLGVWQKINTGYRWMYVINLSKAAWNPLVCGVVNEAGTAEELQRRWVAYNALLHEQVLTPSSVLTFSLWVIGPGTFSSSQKFCIFQYRALYSYIDHKSSDCKHWRLWEIQYSE